MDITAVTQQITDMQADVAALALPVIGLVLFGISVAVVISMLKKGKAG